MTTTMCPSRTRLKNRLRPSFLPRVFHRNFRVVDEVGGTRSYGQLCVYSPRLEGYMYVHSKQPQDQFVHLLYVCVHAKSSGTSLCISFVCIHINMCKNTRICSSSCPCAFNLVVDLCACTSEMHGYLRICYCSITALYVLCIHIQIGT
jgi:hypothetical protein